MTLGRDETSMAIIQNMGVFSAGGKWASPNLS
jgi:hypothetical protein